MKASTIIACTLEVTKKWAKQRKREERGNARSRRSALVRSSSRVTQREVAFANMEAAYQKASDHGKYPVSARQLYYASRGPILQATGKTEVSSQYFTQTLIPEYLRENPVTTANWDVTYDARGHLLEPHTLEKVPLGTIDVRNYVSRISEGCEDGTLDYDFDYQWPTIGPENRMSALLFIEKEGFWPLFKKAKLSERYDLGIMSTKGMPVVACRHLIDELCGLHDIPLLVLHDFDHSGLLILHTLRDGSSIFYRIGPDWSFDTSGRATRRLSSTKRYEYENEFEVHDLGLGLYDVNQYELEGEPVTYKKDPREQLHKLEAPPQEIEYLCSTQSKATFAGHRVELNALTSPQLLSLVEEGLNHHGIKKVIPAGDETLDSSYRRAYQIRRINQEMASVISAAEEEAEAVTVPCLDDLYDDIEAKLEKEPEKSWDVAIAEIMEEQQEEEVEEGEEQQDEEVQDEEEQEDEEQQEGEEEQDEKQQEDEEQQQE